MYNNPVLKIIIDLYKITTGESHDSPVIINLKSNTMKNTVQI